MTPVKPIEELDNKGYEIVIRDNINNENISSNVKDRKFKRA